MTREPTDSGNVKHNASDGKYESQLDDAAASFDPPEDLAQSKGTRLLLAECPGFRRANKYNTQGTLTSTGKRLSVMRARGTKK